MHGFVPVNNHELRMYRYSTMEEFECKIAYKPKTIVTVGDPDSGELTIEPTLTEVQLGEYYGVKFRRSYQIGIVQGIAEDQDLVTLKMMRKKGKGFFWPDSEKHDTFQRLELLLKLVYI